MSTCCDPGGTKNRAGWRRFLNIRVAIMLGVVTVVGIGLAAGGWGWLIAAGLAPIILSILACLTMCGLGLCMMGMNKSKSTVAPVINEAIQSGAGGIRPDDVRTSPATASTLSLRIENSARNYRDRRWPRILIDVQAMNRRKLIAAATALASFLAFQRNTRADQGIRDGIAGQGIANMVMSDNMDQGHRIGRGHPTISKRLANYQASPNHGRRCAACCMFVPGQPAHCTMVEGVISPNGYCKYWQAGPADTCN